MNYTNNYHLPQWDKSDRIMMEDFNQAMSNIDSGIERAVSHGTSAASQAESKASALAAQAHAAADTALAAAQAAQATADRAFYPEFLPYKAGVYVGNGGTLALDLGFRPSFAILSAQYVGFGSDGAYMREAALVGQSGNLSSYVKFTDTGLDIYTSELLNLNRDGGHYSYIAFR